ncbi:redoxin domain-containing protein [bacterium]|nr:redoxin domain-containing protein [bacterium]
MVRKLSVLLMAALMTMGSVALADGHGDGEGAACKEKAAQCAEGMSKSACSAACKEKAAECAEGKMKGDCSAECKEKAGECPEGKEKGACCAEGMKAGECAEGKAKADCCSADMKAGMKSLEGKGEMMREHAHQMVKNTAASPYRLGSQVEDFSLTNAATGESVDFKSVAGEKATVVIFWNQECPYVKEAQDRIAQFQKDYAAKGVNVVAIDSGINNASADLAEHAKSKPFPVLENKDSQIAAKFGASRTPEVFVLDGNMNVQYHGAFDSGKFNEDGELKSYVENAVNDLLAGNAPSVKETRAFGCGLKYARGVRPTKS